MPPSLSNYLSPILVGLITLLGLAANYGAFTWRLNNHEKRIDGLEDRERKRFEVPMTSLSQHD
jgi:hypothetical protein